MDKEVAFHREVILKNQGKVDFNYYDKDYKFINSFSSNIADADAIKSRNDKGFPIFFHIRRADEEGDSWGQERKVQKKYVKSCWDSLFEGVLKYLTEENFDDYIHLREFSKYVSRDGDKPNMKKITDGLYYSPKKLSAPYDMVNILSKLVNYCNIEIKIMYVAIERITPSAS